VIEGESNISLADRIEHWPTTDLIPNPRNARTHTDAQIEKIAAAIVEFGFTNPILVDGDSGILAGHGRRLAAMRLGLPRVPVIQLAGLSDRQRRAYIIADNRLALDAGWNYELLAEELNRLAEEDFDLGLTGFDEAEIADLLQIEDEGLEEEGAPEPAAAAPSSIAREGDTWNMGTHALTVGGKDTAACDSIITSWQAYTRLEATLAGDGRTFAKMAAARLGK